MQFSQKLRLLMELTSTKSSQLASIIKVDPSLVSRLLNGKRQIPKNAEYLKTMSEYFAAHITTNYQRDALLVYTEKNYIDFSNITKTAQVIESWLLSDDSTSRYQTGEFLSSFDRTKLSFSGEFAEESLLSNLGPLNKTQVYAFYGDDGKRVANLFFEELILSADRVCHIKLITEGNVDWLWKDSEYSSKVTANIKEAVLMGFEITRIVPRNQSISMAYDSVRRWLSLYSTGRVNSYYYPYLRDQIAHRTLYVAPGIAALSSIAIGNQSESRLTTVTTNPEMISAYSEELDDYLNLCVPATAAYFSESSEYKMRQCLTSFYECEADCITISGGLSFITTPKELFLGNVIYSEEFNAKNLEYGFDSKLLEFEKTLEKYSCTEILTLDSLDDVIAGKTICIANTAFQGTPLFYTADAYIMHLNNIVEMLEKHQNYNVILSESREFESAIYVKEGFQVLIFTNNEQKPVYKIEYSEMVSSIWGYTKEKTRTSSSIESNKKEVISKIDEFVCQLKNYN